MFVLCTNRKCEFYRDEVCKIDETNCRIFMWDEIENCPESIIEEPKNTEEDKAMFQTMREADEKLEKDKTENEKVAFKEIRKLVSAYKVRKLREYMSDTHNEDLQIVDTHGAVKPQDEPFWFKQAYVSQSCGYSGDDYSGTIWIPLSNGKYLKYWFCC